MPVYKCGDNKYRIGTGKCMYTSKSKAMRAYHAYLAKKHSEENRVITAKDLLKLCNEGTWDIPQTRQQADKLISVFKRARNGVISLKDLNGLVGDDDLFDAAAEENDEQPTMKGMIPVVSVVSWVNKMMDDHGKRPDAFSDDWSDEDKTYLRNAIKPFANMKWSAP
jgi:hypothetical protein